AGMAADLFETYAVTSVAVMLLGVLTFNQQATVAIFPLVIGGVSLLASIVGTFAVRSRTGNVEGALYKGLIVSGVLAALAFIPITYWFMHKVQFKASASHLLTCGGGTPGWGSFWLCTLIG